MINTGTDVLSLATTPVELCDGKDVISQGTGFIHVSASVSDFAFLITNYHVIAGVEPGSGEKPEGDSIRFYVHSSVSDSSKVLSFSASTVGGVTKGSWLQHPSIPEVDVVAIPLPVDLLAGVELANAIGGKEGPMLIKPTSPVTLIGYPHGLHDSKNKLPVWKTGAIASEPEIDFNGQPLFLVDVAAFAGMSGSPVLAIAYGTFMRRDGMVETGYSRDFLGVYASMYMQTEHAYLEEISQKTGKPGVRMRQSLQLGCVWKRRLLSEIVGTLNRRRLPKIHKVTRTSGHRQGNWE